MPPIRLDLDFLWSEVILWNPLPAQEVVSPVSIGQYLANCTISVAALQINVFAWHLHTFTLYIYDMHRLFANLSKDQLLCLNQLFQLRLQAWWRGQMARHRYAAVQEMLGDECGLLCWVANVVGICVVFFAFISIYSYNTVIIQYYQYYILTIHRQRACLPDWSPKHGCSPKAYLKMSKIGFNNGQHVFLETSWTFMNHPHGPRGMAGNGSDWSGSSGCCKRRGRHGVSLDTDRCRI